ncbi:MAG: hypothetical protein NTY07_10690 [Bacteroidia bacterium]|nr:hypothetical protein [Bacteroidia bacterium]
MPYRRLPNTDQARLRALQTAIIMGQKKETEELAFSTKSLNRLRAFYTNFETTIIHHKLARKQQEKSSNAYLETVRKARLYLSHFIQILNFAIQRGDMKPTVREFYGFNDKKSPSLILDSEVLEWGKKIIEGEHQRINHGGNPLYNPSIAVVKVKFDQFLDAYHFQKTLQNNTARWTGKVAELRKEADEIILDIWNEVEERFSDLPDDFKREKSTEYGLIYVYRPMERIKTAHYSMVLSEVYQN